MFELIEALKKLIFYNAERQFYLKHFPAISQNATEISFRPMKKSDMRAVMAIEQSAYEFPWEPGIFRDCLRVGYCCWVGERAGCIVSYGILSVGGGESHVLNICVAPWTQGQGYGRRMMEKLIEVARSHKAEMMLLEVRPSNRVALSLYRKLGFNEIGSRKGYYPAKNGREDAIVLARTL
jgi:ribosomal-protein-alanine N-acetyltransferase